MSAAEGPASPGIPDLDTLFAPLAGASGIVAAVSGGPDSIALLNLLARWRAGGLRPPLAVATIDHGLRPEAAEEARLVARLAADLGLPHHTLPWTGPKPARGVQEAARAARYALLVDLARRGGASHLVTAHTRDDQAETILMRLSRGSGPAGLAGMRPSVGRDGIVHARPLLGSPKAALVALCRAEGWPFVEDPSNRDERYARARWRRLMPALAAEGLTAERLARLALRAARAEEALDAKAQAAFRRACLDQEPLRLSAPILAEDPLRLSASVLAEEPFEIALRVLALALRALRDGEEPLRLARLESCTEALLQAAAQGRALRRTLAGALVSLDPRGQITVSPEPPRHRGR